MPLNFLFALSRYLNRLPRHKHSKFKSERKNYEWARDLHSFPGNAYYVLPRIECLVFLGIASAACLEFGIGQ